MKFEVYDYLPDAAKKIREEVFCNEQGFKNEFDETDNVSSHIVAFEGGLPIAVCRVYTNGENSYGVGRIAVIKAFRGENIGARIIGEAENYIRRQGGTKIIISAQMRVEEFYRKQGYLPDGEIYFDEYCPHIKMFKKLN